MKNSTISRVIFLFSMMLCTIMYGQKLRISNLEDSKMVFGKAYTKDELKSPTGVIRCASTSYEKFLQAQDPKRLTDAQFEAWIKPLIENAKNNKSTSGGIVTIPVVVHVIHSGEAYGTGVNITDEQVQSQITVMNQDFRRMSGTPGFNTSAVGADTMIQFALAKVDLNGNPTNGIDRVNLCYASWSTANINGYVKPITIWDPTLYMNMWSVKFTDTSLLGYAQFPSNSGLLGLNTSGGAAYTDGVVANYATFGSTDFGAFPMTSTYDKGRTMTHEVGHFLGLRHIWGDASCGDDFCADTPTANTANYICNTNKAGCITGQIEMVQNYMDYTNDTCMNIYTVNQKDRITAVMNNSPRRMELKTSTKDVAIPLFANDAEIKLERFCNGDNSTCTASARTMKISFYNRGTANITSAAISYTVGANAQTYNYSGNLAPGKYAIIDLPFAATIPSGSLTMSVTTVNTVADQRASNSSLTTYYVSPGPAAANNGAFTFTLQNDHYGTEVSWNLKDSSGTTVYQSVPYTDTPTTNPLPAPITQTWNLTAGCYTLTMNDVYGDGIYDDGGFYNLKNAAGTVVFQGTPYELTQTRSVNITVLATGETKLDQFSIYPNPATDVLNITKVSNKAKFEIHNAVGQLVKAGDINNNQVRVAELVKGTYIITIKDKNISENLKFIKK